MENTLTAGTQSFDREHLLDTFRSYRGFLSLRQLQALYPGLPRRTLQRWLSLLVKDQKIVRQGSTRDSCYQLNESRPDGSKGLMFRDYVPGYVMNRVMQQVISHPEQPVGVTIETMLSPRVISRLRKNLQKNLEQELATLSAAELKKYYRLPDEAIANWEAHHHFESVSSSPLS